MSVRLLLVRHGESTWNAVRRWQGRSDPPLSPRGERQATDAARSLAGLEAIDAIATSSLRRARRTGELIAQGLGVELVAAEPDLDERSAGPWEGMTRVEIERDFPGFLHDERRPEGYESDAELLARVLPALQRARARATREGHQRIVIVSHGGVLGALERRAHEISTGTRPQWRRFDNLEGRWFTLDADGVVALGERVPLAGRQGPDDPPPTSAPYA